MAHSTRRKEKTARGGKTRHQELKSNRSAQQAERLRAAIAWGDSLATKSETKTDQPKKKLAKINMWSSTLDRRKGALGRLQIQLVAKTKPNKTAPGLIDLTIGDIHRIESEITTLKSRI